MCKVIQVYINVVSQKLLHNLSACVGLTFFYALCKRNEQYSIGGHMFNSKSGILFSKEERERTY